LRRFNAAKEEAEELLGGCAAVISIKKETEEV
jgi:hypothetical protein